MHPFLLQIQNQLPGAIFPYVFYPVKLPKSITMDAGLLFLLYVMFSIMCCLYAVFQFVTLFYLYFYYRTQTSN